MRINEVDKPVTQFSNCPASFNVDTQPDLKGVVFASSEESAFGFSVSSAGDINSDGVQDLIIGASDRAYVIYGGMLTYPFDTNMLSIGM